MTREEIDEIKRHFDVVAERLETKIALVAEGHQLLVDGQRRLEGKVDGLEQQMERFEGEIKAMLRLSFAELDRRVQALEATLTALEGRVVRLEAHVA